MAEDKHSGKLVVTAIVAMSADRVIGSAGKLPWHIPEDMKRFSALTRGHAVLMGRKTYDSLPTRFKPLPQRLNVVASRRMEKDSCGEGVLVINSPLEFIKHCRAEINKLPSRKLWVIGGEQIYRSTIDEWDEIELTLVEGEYSGDAHFPQFEAKFAPVWEERHNGYLYRRYERSH